VKTTQKWDIGGQEADMKVIARSASLLGKITVLVMVCLCVNSAVALDGSGTQEDPWRIKSLEDFNDFAADANYWAGFTRLETDVNLVGLTYSTAVIAPDTNSSVNLFQGTAFTGVFDGNDHKIINMTIDGGTNDYLGLFGHIDYNGKVRNLGLEDSNVSGAYAVGGLIGDGWYGSVSNCSFIGSVIGTWRCVGGLMGSNWYGSVSNCYSASSVSGFENVGGLVGNHWNGSVSNCSFTGSVIGNYRSIGGLAGFSKEGNVSNCYSAGFVSGYEEVGGLIGRREHGSVSNCSFTGSISGEDNVGGLVGTNWSNLSSCYSTGDVSGDYRVGGLSGSNIGNVSNCYSTGDVNGVSVVGGLVGQNGFGEWPEEYPGYISNSYSTGSVQGVSNKGGLVGYNHLGNILRSFWDMQTSDLDHSDGGTGKTTDEMQTMSTFTDAGWDFINVWNMGENQTYPYLRIYLAADLNKDGIVNFLDVAITANQWMEGVE
jgi:hypothetical protein